MPMHLPTFTLWQPWAGLIFHGKDIENRPSTPPEQIAFLVDGRARRFPILGQRLAIHAGKTFDKSALEDDLVLRAVRAVPENERGIFTIASAVLGTVILDGVIPPRSNPALPMAREWWNEEQYGWVLAEPEKYERPFTDVRGAQGIWLWKPPAPAGRDGPKAML
ncbi:hypothetical protein K8I61_00880 [bacterium]|nr:hypothetical protein [bacterium]